MSYVDVPGASLYYETVGSGPLLLCISGANGSVEIWKGLAEHLKSNFTVGMYDRRGFSRSKLQGEQDYSRRLETDADDAAALLKHLSPDEPALVLGSSSGALVALQLLVRHPDVVKLLLCHEPPAVTLLPDFQAIEADFEGIYQTYRERGIPPAVEQFANYIKAGEEHDVLVASLGRPEAAANTTYWFEHEMAYTRHELELEALRQQKEKLVLLLGRGTDREALQHRPNLVLAESLGLGTEGMPGMHVGFALHAEAWAEALVELLKRRQLL